MSPPAIHYHFLITLLEELKLQLGNSWSPDQQQILLQRISKNFEEIELDRELLEKSLKLASEEMQDNYAQLLQSTKLASLGEMASGVGHEINNPLHVILVKTQIMLRQTERKKDLDLEKLIQGLKLIEHHALRISRIVKSLMKFSREGDSDPFESTQVEDIVKDTLALCKSKIEAGGIRLMLPDSYPQLQFYAKPSQISQVLINLFNNAVDAIQGLSSEDHEKVIRLEVESHDECIDFFVSDSGPGVAKEIEDKIMQPFFTTKDIGKGTGLGLSISLAIAQRHGGFVKIERTRGDSCFHLRIRRGLEKRESQTSGSAA